MATKTTLTLPKTLAVCMVFVDGEYDNDATMTGIHEVVEGYRMELAEDSDAIATYCDEVFAARGKDGVAVSTLDKGFLVAQLHEKMGSNADPTGELFKRNAIKLAANLPDLTVSLGRSGVRRGSPEEIAARRVIKAGKLADRKARKAAEKAAFEAFKASQKS